MVPQSEKDASPEIKEPILEDRATLGHWAGHMVEKNTLLEYQARNNSSSLDDCPGVRASMRDNGDRVWLVLMKARIRNVIAQKEALTVGFLLGVILILVIQATWGRFGLL